jgi:signal peptidase
MEPHLEKGDLVVVTAPDRWTVEAAHDTGIVTTEQAGEYERLGGPGDVIVYVAPGRQGSPIIHRAHFYVEEGENWYPRADPTALPGGVENCAALLNCPAPHSGYVTKGDANAHYDQANGIAAPVQEEWVVSKGRFRVPWLGWIRLLTAAAL